MILRAVLTVIILSLAGVVFAPAQVFGKPHPAKRQQQTSKPYFKSIAELQNELSAGKTTSVKITSDFIRRIRMFDQQGPDVDSVIELNPDAMKIARERDQARQSGKAHGPLFGIPFMVKDNMDTGDRMQTTAGSLALVGPSASRDATVVAKLRAAGAILLGKTNLSEWANFRATYSTSGWSGRGGLTRNPYVLSRNTCGSSSGSAAAVSAGFVTVALGTETDGSITCPSSVNGIVGIKPTLGLTSRAGIIPVSHHQDVPGPMARTVADAAAVLTAIAGSDPRDSAIADADKHATDYTKFLKLHSLRGKRIGVVCGLAPGSQGFDPSIKRILNRDVAALRSAGATVEAVKVPHLHDYGKAEFTMELYDFKHDLNAYLKTRQGLKVKTLADIIAFNRSHAAREMPWFKQDLFIKAEAKGPLTDKAYTQALAKEKRLSGPQGIDPALKAHKLDALMAPASGPAWKTDFVDNNSFAFSSGGDHYGGGDEPAAVAGYPSITVPGGNAHGLPVDMTFFAGKWSEPKLISIGYGFEQITKARIRPHFEARAPAAAEIPALASNRKKTGAARTSINGSSAAPASICSNTKSP